MKIILRAPEIRASNPAIGSTGKAVLFKVKRFLGIAQFVHPNFQDIFSTQFFHCNFRIYGMVEYTFTLSGYVQLRLIYIFHAFHFIGMNVVVPAFTYAE